MANALDFVKSLPKLLDEWGSYSYALLTVLLLLGVGAFVYARVSRARKSPKVPVTVALLLVTLSAAGLLLKLWGAAEASVARSMWVTKQQAHPGERRIVISNLVGRSAGTAGPERDAARKLVTTLSSVLSEDLPASLPMPNMAPVDFDDPASPWRDHGVDQTNFSEIASRLKAMQIVWGEHDAQQSFAKGVFIGFRPDLVVGPTGWVPLNDLPLGDDPRRDVRFGPAYYRLLGQVSLGVALDTWRAAEASAGEERKRLFQIASQQITDVQSNMNSHRDDTMLKKTVYGDGVQRILEHCRTEAGVTP